MREVTVSVVVNGQARTLRTAPQTLLVQLLREHLGLTGTHVGCDTAQCGACTVLVDGQAVKSCNLLAVQADRTSVTTVEGLAGADGELHTLQRAFSRHHALQCGYCTPGMLMRARALLDEDLAREADGDVDPVRVAHALGGNLCRCTGYVGIVNAIREVLVGDRR